MRVIHKIEDGQFKALVRGRNQFGEFEVDFYVGGVVQAPARYYTEDRSDAEGTAEAWVAGQVAGGVSVGVGADVVGAGNAAGGVG